MSGRWSGRLAHIGGLIGAVALLAACTDSAPTEFVALAPPESWLETARISDVSSEDSPPAEERAVEFAVVAPADAADELERMIYVQRYSQRGQIELENGEPIDLGSLSGQYVSHVSHRRWAILEVGDGRNVLELRAIEGTSSEVLADLAATIDIDLPITDQEWGPDWVPVALWTDGERHEARRVAAVVPGDASVVIATANGIGAAAMYLRFDIFLSTRVEVRGHPGVALRYGDDHLVMLTWNEAPELAAWLAVSSVEDDPLAHALRIADSLEQIDEERWDEIAERSLSG